jgi:hypothetical protein
VLKEEQIPQQAALPNTVEVEVLDKVLLRLASRAGRVFMEVEVEVPEAGQQPCLQ